MLAGALVGSAAIGPRAAADLFVWQPHCDSVWQTCCNLDQFTMTNNWGRTGPAPICPAFPGGGDNVTVVGDCIVGPSPAAAAGTLEQSGGTFTLNGGSLGIGDYATFDGPFVWNSGELARSGGADSQYAQMNAGLIITGDADKILSYFGGFRLINAGEGSWSGAGNMTIGMIPGGCCPAIFENAEGATFDVQNDATIFQTAYGVGSIENRGTLFKSSSTGVSEWAVNLYNSGLVHVQSGELRLTRAGSADGLFQVDAGATLRFAGNFYELLPGADIVGEGEAIVSNSGTNNGVVVNSDLTLGRLTIADDGRVGGTGTLSVADRLDVQGGDLPLYTTVMPGAEMHVSGSAPYLGPIDVEGTLRIVTGAVAGCFNQVLSILEGGEMVIEDGATFGQTGLLTQELENYGTIRKGPGTGTSFIANAFNVALNNHASGILACDEGTLEIYNNLDLEGRLEIGAGATIKLHAWANYFAGATVVGDGVFHLDNAGNHFVAAGAELGVDNMRISGVYYSGHGIGGDGSLRIRRSLEWDGGGVWTSSVAIDPGALVRATGTTYHSCDAVWQNAGTFENVSGGMEYYQFDNLDGAVIDLQSNDYFGGQFGNRPLSNAGLLKKTGGAGDQSMGSHITNSGDIELYTGRLLVNSLTQTAGATRLVGGGLYTSGGVTLNGGVFEGYGTVWANVNNTAGAVAPGDGGPGILTINSNAAPFIAGNYTQGASASLRIEIGGYGAGNERDYLNVAGAASLNGGLNIALIDGYVPQLGDQFPILTAASRTGTFSHVSGVQIADGLQWQVEYTNNNVIARVVKGGTYPGDLNGDRHTKLDDLSQLLTSYGSCDGQPAFDPTSDLDGDGCVEFDDLWMLLSTFGR
jgi:hypothetical protein